MRNTSNCTLRITKSTPKKPCCSSEKTDKEAALQTLRQRFPCVRPMPRRGGINARLAYDFFRFLKRPHLRHDRIHFRLNASYLIPPRRSPLGRSPKNSMPVPVRMTELFATLSSLPLSGTRKVPLKLESVSMTQSSRLSILQ